jgi:uncharacterized membrane protein YsdA (DUF1294 family)
MPNPLSHYSLPELVIAFIAINAVTFLLFWRDKRLAAQNDWRIPEYLLLGISLAGGSPAAYYAMRRLRHKTRKLSFRIRFWGIVAIQILTLGYWLLQK